MTKAQPLTLEDVRNAAEADDADAHPGTLAAECLLPTDAAIATVEALEAWKKLAEANLDARQLMQERDEAREDMKAAGAIEAEAQRLIDVADNEPKGSVSMDTIDERVKRLIAQRDEARGQAQRAFNEGVEAGWLPDCQCERCREIARRESATLNQGEVPIARIIALFEAVQKAGYRADTALPHWGTSPVVTELRGVLNDVTDMLATLRGGK